MTTTKERHPAHLHTERDLRDWERMLANQHGVVDVVQLRAFGVTRDIVRANLAAQRWHPLLPRTYATFTGPPSRAARHTAALLYAGPYAVLSHETAAAEWGWITPRDDDVVHVTVPYLRSAASRPGEVVVHRSRMFEHLATDRTPLPLTGKADTIVDMAASRPTAEAAQRELVALFPRSGLMIDEIRAQFLYRPPSRHRAALIERLDELAGGVHRW